MEKLTLHENNAGSENAPNYNNASAQTLYFAKKESLPKYMTHPGCRRWLLWCIEFQNSKPTKRPYCADGMPRTKPLDTAKDWARLVSFDEAYKVFSSGSFSGLGFALGPDGKGGNWQGIDLDNIADKPELLSLTLPGYVENSPSKKGLHSIGYGREFQALGSNSSGIEAYSRGRFFTVTGDAQGFTSEHLLDLADYVEQTLRPMHSKNILKKHVPAAIAHTKSPEIISKLRNDLESALLYIPSDDYNEWIAVGHALYELGEDGYNLWVEWSKTSDKFQSDVDPMRWKTFSGERTNYHAVFARAERNGWVNPNQRIGAGTVFENSEKKPIPLSEGLPEVMPWNDNLLPLSLREHVRDIAERTQCPPDFFAVSLIIGISAVIGRKFSIHPKQQDDWEVVPNQWGCIIGRPSAMKSPALKQALQCLRVLEARAQEKYRSELTQHKATQSVLKMERKTNEDEARKLVKNNKAKAIEIMAQTADDLEEPAPRRYIVNDTTVEKLGELLNQNPNGVLLLRDELYGWLSSMQLEEYAKDRAFYLECFDGNGSFTYDRIGRGTIRIESCCVSVVGGIQPSRLAPLVRSVLDGKMDDGLVQRLQFAVWPDDKKDWKLIDRCPNKLERDRVFDVINKIDMIPDMPRKILNFDSDAQTKFNSCYTEIMQAIRNGDIHPAMQAHLMKMPQTLAGLALLFELVEGGYTTVRSEATDRALSWYEYLKSHAERIYSSAIRAPIIGARLIHERREKIPSPFTPREIVQKSWGVLSTTEAVNEALEVLVDYHYINKQEISNSTGGRKSIKYYWLQNYNQ